MWPGLGKTAATDAAIIDMIGTALIVSATIDAIKIVGSSIDIIIRTTTNAIISTIMDAIIGIIGIIGIIKQTSSTLVVQDPNPNPR